MLESSVSKIFFWLPFSLTFSVILSKVSLISVNLLEAVFKMSSKALSLDCVCNLLCSNLSCCSSFDVAMISCSKSGIELNKLRCLIASFFKLISVSIFIRRSWVTFEPSCSVASRSSPRALLLRWSTRISKPAFSKCKLVKSAKYERQFLTVLLPTSLLKSRNFFAENSPVSRSIDLVVNIIWAW